MIVTSTSDASSRTIRSASDNLQNRVCGDAPFSCSFARYLYLHQRQPCVIEEYPSSHSELNAPRFSLQQLHAKFEFEITNLAT